MTIFNFKLEVTVNVTRLFTLTYLIKYLFYKAPDLLTKFNNKITFICNIIKYVCHLGYF